MEKHFRIFLIPLSIFLLSLLLLPYKVNAQYFGRNKVNYDVFKFKVMHTKHFNIYFYNEEAKAVKYAAAMAERWYSRHSITLKDTLRGKQAIILYDGFAQFSETNVTPGFIGQGTGGFTEPLRRRVVLPLAGPLSETNHVIGHELTHAFQFDITSKNNLSENGLPAASRMPLYFIEGMAEYLSLGPNDPFTAMWMREAALSKLPDISDLTNTYKYFPYRYGQALLAFIGGKYGNQKIGELLRTAASLKSMKSAIDSVLHISPDSLSKQWHAAIHNEYDPLLKVTSRPKDYGKELISGGKGVKSINVSPALSPDGKKLMFFSSRDMFSVDLFLADAISGKIEKNIFKKEFNTHLQNIEYINSTGTWSPDSKKFMFSGTAEGRPTLIILNVKNGKIKRTIRFANLAQIFTPAWSPNGRYIVFSALAGGFSNLYLYDLKNEKLKQLTNDPFSELQPAWSPDGRTIVFSTDRFTTQIPDIKIGNLELAELNPFTNELKKLSCFSDGKNINPQWSSDGKNIYFISNHNGISNIYKLNLENNQIQQITNLYGGVTGITHLSPAISTARKNNKLVFSVFDKGHYSIYTIDSTKILKGKKNLPELTTYNPGHLPPIHRIGNLFLSNLENPYIGLSNATPDTIKNYHPSLSLVGIGQPSVAAGVDRFGTYLGGGIELLWSDMLGNYNLSTALQVQIGNDITDISGLLGYMNNAHRWGWGAVAQQVPFITRGFFTGYENVKGQSAYIEQDYTFKETIRNINGLLTYPFSQVLRMEFSAGYKNISFRNTVTTRAVSLTNGSILINKTNELQHLPSLNLASLSAALVYDNSYMGATGPILGSRFRLEVSPMTGTLSWINVLTDYRQYFMPVKPFTLATRILQAGRYGKSADDPRIMPMFLGYPELVRGYSNSSYSSSECLPNVGCSSYDNLLGSKIAVANIELRFPLLGALGIGSGFYGYFPIVFAVFYDAGVAWTNRQAPSFLGGDRKPVSSFGAAIRINVFGYAVAEVDYVHPFNRPGKKWLWQFTLSQGF